MLMATAVSQLAEKTPGKESVAIESFARALRQVIEQIFLLINHFFVVAFNSYQQLLRTMLVMIVQN
jgi:T-complex protein 1 subunit beta